MIVQVCTTNPEWHESKCTGTLRPLNRTPLEHLMECTGNQPGMDISVNTFSCKCKGEDLSQWFYDEFRHFPT